MKSRNANPTGLAEAFLSCLPAKHTGEILPDRCLDKKLQEIESAARKSWPDINLRASEFMAYLAQRLPKRCSPSQGLEVMQTSDLYLCAACLQGDRAAQQSLMEITLPLVKVLSFKIDATGGLAEEVHQALLERLLSPGAGTKSPRLAQFNGRSRLASWLRVIVGHMTLDLKQSVQRERNLNDGLMMALVSDDNQELAYLKSLYQTEFRKAFHQALAKLSEQEKRLLSHQLIEQLNLEQIAKIYRVTGATICRHLKQVRDNLHLHTRDSMMEHLQISSDEFESIMGLIASRLDSSLCRIIEEDLSAD